MLQYETNCTEISITRWNQLMKGARRANKKKLNSLVKKELPDLYEALSLNLYNPYDYYQTKTHYILVHSTIEYFICKF